MEVAAKPDQIDRTKKPEYISRGYQRLREIKKDLKKEINENKNIKPLDRVNSELSKKVKELEGKIDTLKKARLEENRIEQQKITGKNPAEIVTKISKMGTLRKPAVIFIGGMNFLSSGSSGMKDMAGAITDGKHYSWNQKSEIIKEIDKRNPQAKVVLVGHGLGADTAHEIAEKLNNLEHGFRKVDLLVTIDSVGFNNDIIPQNVKKNLNFFGESNLMINDSPNISRNNQLTEVVNELSKIDHDDLPDSNQIQYKIINSIKDSISALPMPRTTRPSTVAPVITTTVKPLK